MDPTMPANSGPSGYTPGPSQSEPPTNTSPSIDPQDMSILKSAFTPQVIAVLQKLAGSSDLGQADSGQTVAMTDMGTMGTRPPSGPSLPAPATRLGSM